MAEAYSKTNCQTVHIFTMFNQIKFNSIKTQLKKIYLQCVAMLPIIFEFWTHPQCFGANSAPLASGLSPHCFLCLSPECCLHPEWLYSPLHVLSVPHCFVRCSSVASLCPWTPRSYRRRAICSSAGCEPRREDGRVWRTFLGVNRWMTPPLTCLLLKKGGFWTDWS